MPRVFDPEKFLYDQGNIGSGLALRVGSLGRRRLEPRQRKWYLQCCFRVLDSVRVLHGSI